MEQFWKAFEKQAYSWKAQAIGSAAAPAVGAGVGAFESEGSPYRGAIMGGMAGGGAAIGSAGGKVLGDLLKGIAEGNPEKLKSMKTLGKYLPLILGVGGASVGSFKAMRWLAGLRDGKTSADQPEQSLQAQSTGP